MCIRIGFSRTNTIPSKIIRWILDSPVSHSYIRFFDEYLNAWLVIHADWPYGVIIEDAQTFDADNEAIVEYEIHSVKNKEVLKSSMRFLKKKYNLWMLLKWAWWIYRKKTKNNLSDLWPENPSKLICVEFTTFFIRNLAPTYSKEKLNPKELNEWLEARYIEFGWSKYEL